MKSRSTSAHRATARKGRPKRSTASRNGSPGGRAPDAIALLKRDHQTVRKLLSELAETTSRGSKKREELCERIGREIRIHASIEEKILYPAFRDAAEKEEDSKIFFEATEEHAIALLALAALEQTDPGSEVFGARAKVVKDLIEHHAEEEEDEMFPRAKRLLGAEELRRLGAELAEMKESLQRAPPGELTPARRSSRLDGLERVRGRLTTRTGRR